MNRVNWDGSPLEKVLPSHPLPANLRETIFDYLPPPVPITPVIEEMAQKYVKAQFTGQTMGAMQAAYFLQPRPQEFHRKRRDAFRLRAAEAEADGFVIPDIFRELVETDAYVDRLHHNTIWLEMSEELWRLPSDPSRSVFLAFVEGGHGGYNYHLLLAPDGSHCVVSCVHPFGVPSNWPVSVPDYSQWTVERCADSIEEWLYHYFLESAEHDRGYIERLRPYHPNGWGG